MSDSFSDVSDDANIDLEQILNSSDDDEGVNMHVQTTFTVKQNQLVLDQQNLSTLPSLNTQQHSNSAEYENVLRRQRRQREEEEEAIEEAKESKENKLNQINPLDIIDEDEGQLLNNEDKRFDNFDKELILQRTRIPDDFNMEYVNIEGLSVHLFSQVEGEHEYLPKNNYGLPKAMCVSPGKLIIVGTSYGMVVMFEMRSYKIVQVIGCYDDYKKYGSVSSIDLNEEGDTILVGYDKGGLSLFETYSGQCVKQILGVHESPILTAKFWKGRDRLISCDSSGNVFLFKIDKVFWTYSFDKQRLLQKPHLDNPCEIINNIEILLNKSTKTTDSLRFDQSTIIALSSANSIIIVTLEPQVKSLYKIEKPAFIPSNTIPSVSWGYGRAPHSTMETMNYPILAVGWGPLIQLYQMNKFALMQISTQDNVMTVGFDIVGHVVTDHSIFYLQWISPSMIIILNSRNEFRIIYTGETIGGEYFSQNCDNLTVVEGVKSLNNVEDSDQKKGYVKHQYSLNNEINFTYLVRDMQNKLKRTFNSSILVQKQDIYILTSSCVMKGHFLGWQESIQKYISEKKWLVALKIAQQLYHGKLQSFAKLPERLEMSMKKEFNDFCVNLIMSFLEKEEVRIESITEKSHQTDEVWKLCKIVFEYLIEIQEYDVLFKKTKIHFMRLDQTATFLALLEPFILKNKIKKIPNEYFNEILNYFIDKKKFHVVQIMIINLDLSSINLGETIIKCLQHALFTPLIYITTRKDNDFVAPLYKMYQQFKTLQSDPRSHNQGSKYIYRCLWFLRMTLQQKMYPNEKIDDNKFPIVIKSLVTWFFSDQIIIDFAQLDSFVYFDVIYLFFQGKPADILTTKDHLLFNYFLSEPHNQGENNVVNYAEYVHEQMIKKIEKLLRLSMNSNEKMKRDFSSFIGRISHTPSISIDLSICQNSAEFLLTDRSSLLTEREILKKSSDILSLIRRLRKHEDILNQLITKIMHTHTQDSTTTYEKYQIDEQRLLEGIQEMLDNEILAYLSYLLGQMSTAFNFYFNMMQKSSTKGNRYKIFSWLHEAFRNDELSSQQRNDLTTEVIDNIEMLVLISTRYTKGIVNAFLKTKENIIFEKLMCKPSLLLDYLENLLEDRLTPLSNTPPNTTLALYITLLCQLEPTRVVEELQTHFYNLDEIVKLCRLNKAFDAVAFICEKQGNYSEAIHLYTRLFIDECSKTFTRIAKQKTLHSKQNDISQSYYNVLESKFKQLINVCSTCTRAQIDNQTVWFDMAVDILSCRNAPVESSTLWSNISTFINSKKENYTLVNDVFSKIIACLFIQMSNHLSVTSMIELIKNYQHQFSFESIQQSFTTILTTLQQEITFLNEGKEVLFHDLVKQNLNLMKKTTQGNSFPTHCAHVKCGHHLNNYSSNVIVFSCGHPYHQRCLDIYPLVTTTTISTTFGQHHKRKNNPNNNNNVYSCPVCMKEEIPYIQQIELELRQVSQKLQKNQANNHNQTSDTNAIAPIQGGSNRVSNYQMNENTNNSNSNLESQKDSKSVITDNKSNNVKDFKHEREMFRRKQLKRLQRFDVFIQKDIDNFDEIRQKYEKLIAES